MNPPGHPPRFVRSPLAAELRFNERAFIKKIVGADSLPEASVQSLLDRIQAKAYKKKQRITTHKATLFYVTQGQVRLERINDRGETRFSALVEPDQIFGSAYIPDRHQVAVAASDLVHVYTLALEDVPPDILPPTPLTPYFSSLESRLHQVEDYYVNLLSRDVKDRLVFFLENLFWDAGKASQDITHFCPLSAAEIAQFIFGSRQRVHFLLRQLEQEGWIKKEGLGYHVSRVRYETFRLRHVVVGASN